MIANKDRSMWFGASDVNYIIAKNRNTATFKKWWLEKLGYVQNNFSNIYTAAGNNYEHKILDALNIDGLVTDKQIRNAELRLRVNLDGNTDTTIYEVKTFKESGRFRPNRYKKQIWVQMFGSGLRKAYIVAYPLCDNDYKNFFNPIDEKKIILRPVEYNEEFITTVFLPNLTYLRDCLLKGIFPT